MVASKIELVILFYQCRVAEDDSNGNADTQSLDVLARKARVVARLLEVLPQDAVIHDERETRAYECDALTAYQVSADGCCASIKHQSASVRRACGSVHQEERAGCATRFRARLWPGVRCPRQIA